MKPFVKKLKGEALITYNLVIELGNQKWNPLCPPAGDIDRKLAENEGVFDISFLCKLV